MSTTTHVFVEKLSKYLYFLVENSALSKPMMSFLCVLGQNSLSPTLGSSGLAS